MPLVCPNLAHMYLLFMGGVDVFDQLRLSANYSLELQVQLCTVSFLHQHVRVCETAIFVSSFADDLQHVVGEADLGTVGHGLYQCVHHIQVRQPCVQAKPLSSICPQPRSSYLSSRYWHPTVKRVEFVLRIIKALLSFSDQLPYNQHRPSGPAASTRSATTGSPK